MIEPTPMNSPPLGSPARPPTPPGAAALPSVGSAMAEAAFNSALERPPEEREAYLGKACGDDTALLAEVRELLAAHEAAGNFLKTEALLSPEVEHALARGKAEEAGDRIGPYKLLRRLGEGGFGVVWMAEQEQPVQRRVALKIIKPGMDTKEVVARFEQERQALARMDHPNIAKVFDAGATPLGRPYFVMELVTAIRVSPRFLHFVTPPRLLEEDWKHTSMSPCKGFPRSIATSSSSPTLASAQFLLLSDAPCALSAADLRPIRLSAILPRRYAWPAAPCFPHVRVPSDSFRASPQFDPAFAPRIPPLQNAILAGSPDTRPPRSLPGVSSPFALKTPASHGGRRDEFHALQKRDLFEAISYDPQASSNNRDSCSMDTPPTAGLL